MTAAPFVALWASFLRLSPVTFNIGMAGLALLTILVIKYVIELLIFHYDHTLVEDDKGRLPPKIPSFLPFVGSIFQLAIDHKRLTDQVS